MQDATSFQSVSQAKKETQDIKGSLDNNINTVRLDPNMYLLVRNLGDESIDGMKHLTAEQKSAFKLEYKYDLDGAVFDSKLSEVKTTEDVGTLREDVVRDKDSTRPEDFDNRIDVLNRMEANLKKAEESEFISTFEKSLSLIRSGEFVPQLNDAVISSKLSDPEARVSARKALMQAEKEGEVRRGIIMASPSEISAHVQNVEAKIKNPNLSVDDRYEAVSEAARLDQALRARNTEIQQDPVAYVMKHDVGITNAYQDYIDAQNTDDENAQVSAKSDYVKRVIAAQEQLGIDQPYLLTKTEVGQMAAMVGAVDAGPDGAQELVQVLSATQSKWGEHWPHVYSQLTHEGAISGGHVILARMSGDLSKNVASLRLAEALSFSDKDLLSGVVDSSTVMSKIEKATREMAQDFYTTLGWQGATKTVKNYQAAIQKLSALYVSREGSSISDAVYRAYNELVGADYDFVGSYRVPKTLHSDDISRGVFLFKKDVLQGMELEPILDPRLGVMDNDQHVESLIANGILVTNPNETGLLLLDEYGRPVKKSDGNFVDLPWSYLSSLSRNTPRGRRGTR